MVPINLNQMHQHSFLAMDPHIFVLWGASCGGRRCASWRQVDTAREMQSGVAFGARKGADLFDAHARVTDLAHSFPPSPEPERVLVVPHRPGDSTPYVRATTSGFEL